MKFGPLLPDISLSFLFVFQRPQTVLSIIWLRSYFIAFCELEFPFSLSLSLTLSFSRLTIRHFVFTLPEMLNSFPFSATILPIHKKKIIRLNYDILNLLSHFSIFRDSYIFTSILFFCFSFFLFQTDNTTHYNILFTITFLSCLTMKRFSAQHFYPLRTYITEALTINHSNHQFTYRFSFHAVVTVSCCCCCCCSASNDVPVARQHTEEYYSVISSSI